MNRASRLRTPPKLHPGDHVAIVSPSWAGAGVFPLVQEIALRVLRDELGLVPVEYPTTRQVGASAKERAHDLNTAFADPDIKAVMAASEVKIRSRYFRTSTPTPLPPIPRPTSATRITPIF